MPQTRSSRPKRRIIPTLAAFGVVAALVEGSPGAEPTHSPAVMVRVDAPSDQLGAVIDLFRGARAPHPAAALAAWKRASREPKRLGKPAEAVLAAFNPAMVRELGSFDRAEFALDLGPKAGWSATLPGDDGSLAALGPTFAMTDGDRVDPIGGVPVDRLGPPGSPYLARSTAGTALASDRDRLASALERLARKAERLRAPGISARVDPGLIQAPASLATRRLAEGLEALGFREASVEARVEGTRFLVRGSGRLSALAGRVEPRAIDPAWLDWIPVDRPAAAVVAAVDGSAPAWDLVFEAVDRVEKADPSRAQVAPSRLRLAFLTRAVGLKVEADLLPHLLGVSAWAASDGAFVGFHLDDEATATRLVSGILPNKPTAPDAPREAGRVDDRPILVARSGPSVLVAWGRESLDDSRTARSRPDRSSGPMLRARLGDRAAWSAGAVWPARVPGAVEPGSPLALALAEGPPATWSLTRVDRENVAFQAEWGGLDSLVRRFLDRLPLDPPPDVPTEDRPGGTR